MTTRVPDDLAVAYEFVNGQYRELAPDYLHLASAGFFFTTGTDMARFLIAHLRYGAYEHGRILQPETVALMHARHFAQTPDTSGWGYGIWEDVRDGQRAHSREKFQNVRGDSTAVEPRRARERDTSSATTRIQRSARQWRLTNPP
jgi:CubicO group peptidase (beta-lactamase class C family)